MSPDLKLQRKYNISLKLRKMNDFLGVELICDSQKYGILETLPSQTLGLETAFLKTVKTLSGF